MNDNIPAIAGHKTYLITDKGQIVVNISVECLSPNGEEKGKSTIDKDGNFITELYSNKDKINFGKIVFETDDLEEAQKERAKRRNHVD